MVTVKKAIQCRDGSHGWVDTQADVFDIMLDGKPYKVFIEDAGFSSDECYFDILSDYRTGWAIKSMEGFYNLFTAEYNVDEVGYIELSQYIIDKIVERIGVEKFKSIISEKPTLNEV